MFDDILQLMEVAIAAMIGLIEAGHPLCGTVSGGKDSACAAIPDICPIVTQSDIDELNAMELERSWLREGIEVGKPWPLTFHQYRRSLSVYAHRSVMVSLPALKGQLQQITDEMRACYSDGFCRAVNLVFDKEHFSLDWNAAKSESSFLAYSLALLFSDEDRTSEIGGRGAVRMQVTVSGRSKEETLKLFRDGKLACRETVLGGRIAVEGCNYTPLEPILRLFGKALHQRRAV
jgi:hypothetical protein